MMFYRVFVMLALVWPLSADQVKRQEVMALIPKLESFIQQGMEESSVPGTAVAIVHDGKVVFAKGYGYRNLETKEPVTTDTVFQVASLSKPIASTILATVVSEGTIEWESRIEDLDASFRLSDPWVSAHLTLRDLLSHRSGLPDHAGDILEDLGYGKDLVLHQLRYIKPLGAFRQDYAYTNFGFSEAGYAVAKALGTTWSRLAKNRLFTPLGMTATSSDFEDYINSPKRAMTYTVTDVGPKVLQNPREPDAQSPAGGVSSTVLDLAKWMNLELWVSPQQEIIGHKALLETQTPVITTHVNEETGLPSFYGMGWDIAFDEQGRRFLKHSGGFAMGVRTQASLLPEEKLGIVILTNASPSGLPEAISKAFYSFLFNGKVEEGLVKKYNEMWLKYETDPLVSYEVDPNKVLPALPLENYTGTFENAYFGPIEIKEQEGSLMLIIGPQKRMFPLRHLNRDVFSFTTQGENAVGETQVIFTLDESEKVREVTIDYLNKFGMGKFSRTL